MNSLLYKLKLYGPKRFLQFASGELVMRVKHIAAGSYSQYGEDVIFDKLLGSKRHGFYVDVGAYDPIRFSNTARFYKRGWRGINIEPDLTQFERLKRARARDINLNIGIGSAQKKLTYYQMNPTTLSTFSRDAAEAYQKDGFTLVSTIQVPVRTLVGIFGDYYPKAGLDFLSIDVEGSELDVLQSNNWTLYRPRVLCVELSFSSSDNSLEVRRKKTIIRFLESKGYTFAGKSPANYFYIDSTKKR